MKTGSFPWKKWRHLDCVWKTSTRADGLSSGEGMMVRETTIGEGRRRGGREKININYANGYCT
jgi:hypothetical protein